MKKLTKEELQQNADRLMKGHKKDKVFATQDGNYFFSHNGAMFHNNDIKKDNKEWDGEIIPFDVVPAAAPVAQENEELKAAIQSVTDAEQKHAEAVKAYNKADKALDKKPDDETAKADQVSAKTEMDNAQVELDNAKTKLASLQK